jgi:hypothetical protein
LYSLLRRIQSSAWLAASRNAAVLMARSCILHRGKKTIDFDEES